jgi:hypothetical protein
MNKTHINEIEISKYNSKMKIIKYYNYENILVEFDNGYTTKATYQQFKNKNIKNPYYRTVYEIGYLGEGKYKPKENNKEIKQYTQWKGMIRRWH